MKLVNFTPLALIFCIYASAQPGTLDGTFNNPGTPGYITTNVINGGDDYAQGMAVQSDGKVVVAVYNANSYITILRYTTSGTLDGTFGSGGIVTLRNASDNDAQAFAVTVLSDNKILVAGYSWGSTKDFALVRLEENGDPDVTFGTNGWAITPVGAGTDEVRTIAVQSDNKIVVAGVSYNGSDNDFVVVRYNADGSPDNSFGSGGIVTTDINGGDMLERLAIQNDGKIVVGGTSNTTGDADFTVVRYNSDGSMDNSFAAGGIATIDIGFGGTGSTDQAHSLAIQSDGKIVIGGQTVGSGGGNDDIAIIRLKPDGTLDSGPSGFDGDGIVTFNLGPVNTDEEVRSLIVQNDGKILIAGSTDGAGSSYSFLLLRYNADGSLDPTFGPGADGIATADISGYADVGYAMALYGTRIYVAGSTGENASRKQVIVIAFSNNFSTLPLTLFQFWGEKQTSKIVLHWQTTAEENVKQFIIEASRDGKTFKDMGYVFALGNSSTINEYSFTDHLPLTGTNYYRLLMQDFDGSYRYSKIVNIKFGEKLKTNVQVYPCPARDVIQIQLPVGLPGSIQLRIIDLQGRVVKSNKITSDGNGLLTSLDIQSLPNGVYLLNIQSGRISVTNRFIKQ